MDKFQVVDEKDLQMVKEELNLFRYIWPKCCAFGAFGA